MAIRIIHITSAHPSFDVRIFHKECKSLANYGYDVIFVVPGHSYGLHEGVRVETISPTGNRWLRMFLTPWMLALRALKLKGNVYHLHDPELIPVGLLLRLLGKKVVFDAHEDLPLQVLAKDWIPVCLRPIISFVSKAIIYMSGLFFTRIVAATPSIAKRFPAKKTFIVQNFPDLNEIECSATIPYTERPANVIYIGGISEIRGVREMVQSMALISEIDVKLLLLGKFDSLKLHNEVQERRGWNRVVFEGWKSRSEVNCYLEKSRAGLLAFHSAPNHLEAQPNKLFEYLAAGIPVVASDFPLWREIIYKYRCGILVNPLNPEEISNVIRKLLKEEKESEEMGKRGQKAIREHFNWGREFQKLLQMYKELMQ